MNDQRMLLQLPNYFSNLTNVGKTLTTNLRNNGKILVLNIDPELCEVDSTILYNCTTMHHYHCSELNYRTIGMFHLVRAGHVKVLVNLLIKHWTRPAVDNWLVWS